MNIVKAIQRRRSIRKYQQKPVADHLLESLVGSARLAPSASNLQPCEYVVVNDPATVDKLFPLLKWAAYISPEGDPPEGQRPAAYIVVLLNRDILPKGGERDVGAAVQNIMLTAVEEGLGSCWVGSIKSGPVAELLKIPDDFTVDSVVALGYSAESPIIVNAKDSIKYWKDARGILYVPKRQLKEIIHWNRFKGKKAVSKED